MKTLIITLLSLTSAILFSQNTATWIGGTPGQETKWDVARNWSNNQVPNESTYVIIDAKNSGHFAQPEIEHFVELASIEILANASLTIKESGEVLINGEYSYTNGIICYGGSLINKGTINFFKIEAFSSKDFQEMVKGNGLIFLDGFALDGNSFVKE